MTDAAPSTAPEPAKPEPAKKGYFQTVTFDEPIVRGEETIDKVQLRRPKAGELRGIVVQAIYQADVVQVARLVPRISSPPLLEQEVYDLESDDFAQLAGACVNFLLPKAVRRESGQDA